MGLADMFLNASKPRHQRWLLSLRHLAPRMGHVKPAPVARPDFANENIILLSNLLSEF